MLSTIFSGAALFSSLVALLFAIYGLIYARRCYQFVQLSNKRSRALREISELQGEMTEISDSVAALNTSMKKLRGRIHARSLNSRKPDTDVPDPKTDPEGWKRYVNRQRIT